MAISTAPDALTRRSLLAGGAALLAGGSGAACADPADGALTPEMFGAKGDGRTNDSRAFSLLAQAVTQRGGGTIALRKTVYIVGEQHPVLAPNRGYGFAPTPLLRFIGLPGVLTIRGNGATLRCEAGLRYGTFDVMTGQPTRHPMPFLDVTQRATPYDYMINVEGCGGAVTITDLELDGNNEALQIGGGYGDTGIQIAGSGLFLRDNRGSETLRNIYSHHHPQDGVMIDGIEDPALARRVTRLAENVRCDRNGRQGCSLVGGRGWTFRGCAFTRTARGKIASAPAAGFDIEAEGAKTIRDLRFEDCEFSDNAGCGLVADSGDSAGVTFQHCRFVGTTMWSAWPNKPAFRFSACTFVGTVVRTFVASDAQQATRFTDCLFTDDSKLAPGGRVYREGRADGPLVDAAESSNPYFDRCRFLAVGGAVLPWSIRATYTNCTMRQTSHAMGYPRGVYAGRNTIDAPALSLYGIRLEGEVILNGKPFHP